MERNIHEPQQLAEGGVGPTVAHEAWGFRVAIPDTDSAFPLTFGPSSLLALSTLTPA